jgi:hypothetical protein
MYQYIDYIVYFNIKDSHYLNKYIILYVFYAFRYDSIVLLS